MRSFIPSLPVSSLKLIEVTHLPLDSEWGDQIQPNLLLFLAPYIWVPLHSILNLNHISSLFQKVGERL